ncbi:MAG: tRNA pseudouridine synthase A [Acidobacteriaceae bacterium]
MMRERSNWKLTLAYDGAEFHGWQVQPGRPTIQGALAAAVAAVTGECVLPQGSGRTDAGVHACGQVASLSLEAAIPAENLQRALNRILPASIRIRSAERVPAEFHARHSAIGKIYEYRIFHGRVCPPFLARYVTCWRWPLDLEAMQQGAEAILGEHDFTSFAATDPDRTSRVESEEAKIRSNVRRIEQSQWRRDWLPLSSADGLGTLLLGSSAEPTGNRSADHEAEMFTYTVRGNGFLHHMVRNLVGTFLDMGRGHVPATEMLRILEGCGRRLAGPTASANGLCLMQVLY